MTEIFEYRGIRFHYEAIGNGPELVFCHGLGGDRSQPKKLLGEITSHRVLVWDARGHGQTEPTGSANNFTFDRFAKDLRELLDHLCIKRAVIGGISMGAGVAIRFALDHPNRVRGVVLVRPAWLDESFPQNLNLFPAIGDLLGKFSPSKACEVFVQEFAAELEAIRGISPLAEKSLLRQFDKPGAAKRRMRLVRMPSSSPITNWNELVSLSIPTLVVGTDQDPVHPLTFAHQWAQHLPAARFVQIQPKTKEPLQYVQMFRKSLRQFLYLLEDYSQC